MIMKPSMFCHDCNEWTAKYNSSGECEICGDDVVPVGISEQPWDILYEGEPIESK